MFYVCFVLMKSDSFSTRKQCSLRRPGRSLLRERISAPCSPYLCHDPEASCFAKLSLVSGSSWSQSSERMVHRAVLGALAPILIKQHQVDMVIVPDATEDSLVTITELIYTGRSDCLINC